MPLLLRADEIASLLDMPKAITLVEEAIAQHGEGLVGEHAPYFVDRGDGGNEPMRVVSGALWRSERMGIRLIGATGGTPPSVRVAPIAILYSTSGELLAIMGYPFSTLRTGASVAVAIKYLAREDAKRVGLLGPARNAFNILLGVSRVRPVETIKVFGRNPERRREFCNRASEIVGFPVEPVESAREAVAGMDIVLTQTESTTPVFEPEWLEDGQLVSASGTPRISELHPDVFLRAKLVVVGSKEHVRNVHQGPPMPLVDLVDAGQLSWESVRELGEVVSGKAPGRQSAEDVIIFHESGGGPNDIALVAAAYEEACRQHLGRSIDL